MRQLLNLARVSLAILFIAACFSNVSFAQADPDAHGRFFALPPHSYYPVPPASSHLTQWNGSFKDLTGKTITFTMVGTDPSKTNVTTTLPVVLVPLKLVYGASNGNKTFDPMKDKFPNGQTVVQMILGSPLFQSTVDFVQGGTNVGKTQYEDAFQRANFWGKSVSHNTKYHVLFGKPTVLPEQTIKVTPSQGKVVINPTSGSGFVGEFQLSTLDPLLQSYMHKFKQVQPNTLALFITYDIYGINGSVCCYGGYHSNLGGPPNSQTYSWSTIIDQNARNFAQDVGALSHELGEWYDNPFFGTNSVNCHDNSQLEVGDPIENDANYGLFPYTVGSFTYHLQSLVFLDYFGAPPSTDLHKWISFQNDKKTVCPGQ